MEQAIIFLIVAVFIGLQVAFNKVKAAREDRVGNNLPPDQNPPAREQRPAYEVDQRYQDIQEEIRRRIAQRMQNPPVAPAPMQGASPRKPRPIRLDLGLPPNPPPEPLSVFEPQPPPTPTETAATRAMAMPTAPSSPNADLLAIYGTLAAPEADTTADARPAQNPGSGWKALLARPSAARQAYLLREILDRPLCLRPAGWGGHEEWI